MKNLAKTIAIASMAAVLGVSFAADAKGERNHKVKRAKATKTVKKSAPAESSVPWYEQGIADMAPAHAKKTVTVVAKQPAAPILYRTRRQKSRQSFSPSGRCDAGCDKSARNISMATLILVKDSKKAKGAKGERRTKRARAIKRPTPPVVASSK